MEKKLKLKTLFSLLLLSATHHAFATPDLSQRTIVAPLCLLEKITAPYHTLAQEKSFALMRTNESGIQQLMLAKHQHRSNIKSAPCGGFIDVTERYKSEKATGIDAKTFLNHFQSRPIIAKYHTYQIKYQNEVNQLLKQIKPEKMWHDLTTLTHFKDRYARSDNGVKAAEWLKSQIETAAKGAGHDDVAVYFVKTGPYYQQPSVVAKIGKSNDAGIVIGGHMDTLSSMMSDKPGADDDGSGTVTVLQAAKTVLASGMKFKKPIYIVFYAAEEEGLVGSSYVVKDFLAKKIPVDAVIQFDMTGFAYKNDPTIWLMTDNVDNDLTKFLSDLVQAYVKQPVSNTRCGYACSDHATWDHEGFSAAMPFEASMGTDNPAIHTTNDTMEKLSLEHMTDYTKLAVAYAVELAEPVK